MTKVFVHEAVTIEQKVIKSIICDRCKTELSDLYELQEVFPIAFTGGYGSVFGDESIVRCDLCQHCLYEMIKDFCVIEDCMFDWYE